MKFLIILICALFLCDNTNAEQYRAEDTEPPYARALIEYNDGKLDTSLNKLEALLSKFPEYVPALELKALVLRRKKFPEKALTIYETLIKLADTQEAKAPYHFEIGVIHYEAKHLRKVWPHFQFSAAQGFNWGASNYFLGMICNDVGALEQAEQHFNAVTWSDATDLHGPASFYLGLIYAKMGHPSGVLWTFDAALRAMKPGLSSTDPGTKSAAESITKVAQDTLNSFKKDSFYGNVLLQFQYDNNLPLLPDVIATQQPSNKKSIKLVTTATAGLLTSPTRNWQLNPSHRIYYNHNFNGDAKGYSYFSNIPSLIFTLFPSRRYSPGIKLDGNITFNDRLESGQTVFRPFSLTGNAGAFIRFEAITRLTTTFEILARPKHFYLDPTTEYLKRTGSGVLYKLSWNWNSLKTWLNPSGVISHEFDRTEGREFRARIWTGSVANLFKLTSRDNLTIAADFSRSRFSERNGSPRKDHYMSYRTLYSHTFNKYVTGLADISFTRNVSTVPDSYEYSRFLVSLGANISF